MKLLRENDFGTIDWTSFIEKHPKGNIFQTLDYFDISNSVKGMRPFVFGVEEDGRLIGIVSGIINHSGGISKIFSTRAIIYGGPLLIGEVSLQRKVLSFILLNLKLELKRKVIFIQFRNLWDWEGYLDVFKECGFSYEDHLDILINLETSEEEIWKDFSRDRKKSINKGLNNLRIEAIEGNPEYFSDIYQLLKSVYSRIKLPLPNETYFQYVNTNFSRRGLIKIFGAFKDEKLVGVRLVFCYNKMIYDWYAGADEKYLAYRPNDVLPWEAMKWGANNGYKIFDFGGAGKPNVPYGVRDYKLKFGGELVNFGRFELVNKPILFFLVKKIFNLTRVVRGLFK